MDWQEIAVAAVGILAAAYLLRRSLRRRGGSGCSGCGDMECPYRRNSGKRNGGTTFAPSSGKKRISMKTDYCKERSAAAAAETDTHETRHGEAMRVPVVTQNVPNDGRHVSVSAKGEEPTRQQLEQDVMATNPSVESMESRG